MRVRSAMRVATGVLAGLLFASVSSITQAMAEGPAVSDTNLKVFGFGGEIGDGTDSNGLGGVGASLTLPIAYSLGLQIDAGFANVNDGNFGSGGAHLFWRDPTVGMIGVYAGYASLDLLGGLEVGRVGGEAQYFMDNLTFDAAAGVKFGDLEDQGYGRA